MDGMDLRGQLDALDDTPNSSTAYKQPSEVAPDDELLTYLRDNGSIDRLKQSAVNSKDMGQIDAVARSTADDHQSMMDDWERDIRYRQDLLENDATGQPIDILKSNLAYVQRKFDETKAKRDQAQALQSEQMSDFGLGFSHGALGLGRSLAFAGKQYGESLGSDSVAGAAGGIADLIGGAQKELPAAMSLSDIHGASSLGRYVVQTAGGLAPIIAAGAVGGEIPLAAGFIAMGHGQMREALEQSGVTDKASLAKGTFVYGSLIGGLQLAVPWATLRGLSRPAMEAFSGTVAQISAEVAAGTARMSLAQGLAMGLSTWAEIYGVYDATGKPLDWDEIAKRVPESVGQGLIAGTLFGGAGEGIKGISSGYKTVSPPGKVSDFLETVRGINRDAYAKQFADEIAAHEQSKAAGKPPTDGGSTPPVEPAGVDTAALKQELGTLVTERSPEADARRAEIEAQLAAAEPKAAEAAPGSASPEEGAVLAELAKHDDELGSPILAETYGKLTPTERQEIVSRAKKGENAADLVEEVAIRGVQVKSYLSDNELELPAEGVADISSRMSNGAPIDEAIANYAHENYEAEVARRQGVPEGQAQGETAATSAEPGATGQTALDSGNGTTGSNQPQELGAGADRTGTTGPAAQRRKNPRVAGTEGGNGTERAGTSTVTPEHTAQFHDILRGATPRKQWASALGVEPAQLSELIANAERDGLLRVDRNGVVRRTAKARTGEASPEEAMLAIRGADMLDQMHGEKPSEDSMFALRNADKPRTPTEVKVYHGTGAEMDRFDPEFFGQRTQFREPGEKANRTTERAFFFSDNPKLAEPYAENRTNVPFELRAEAIKSGFAEGDDPTAFSSLKRYNPKIVEEKINQLEEQYHVSGARTFAAFIETKNFKPVDMKGYKWNSDEGTKIRTQINKAKKEGYSGLIIDGMEDAGGSTARQYAVWDKGTVRSAISDAQLFALRGFYSPAIRAAESINQEKGTGEQFWKQITKVPGVKKDELDWMGLEEFLVGKKSITKAEVLDFMRAHQVQLEEKTLSGDAEGLSIFDIQDITHTLGKEGWTPEQIIKQSRELDTAERTSQLRKLFKRYSVDDFLQGRALADFESVAGPTKFEGHKVPGGENYRELLIRLPELAEKSITPEQTARLDEINARVRELRPLISAATGHEAEKLITERRALTSEESSIKETVRPYISKHFNDQELVHLRVDDRTGPNGEKVLFVNEVQSDLHQAGRKKGYATKDLDPAYSANIYAGLYDQAKSPQELAGLIRKEIEAQASDPRMVAARPALDAAAFQLDSGMSRTMVRDNLAETQLKAVPEAPFKGDLWLELALKRAVLYASEHGYDAVSWARSDQIAKAVGADAEGLKLQYDSKIGKFLDKYTKKWGGKVEEADIAPSANVKETADGFEIVYPDGNRGGTFDTRAEADAYIKREFSQETPENQFLRITPEMRASVMEGQPLFARGDSEVRIQYERMLNAGHSVEVHPDIVKAVSAAIEPVARTLPKGVNIGTISRIEPVKGDPENFRGTFQRPDGSTFALPISMKYVREGRAVFVIDANSILSMRFGTFGIDAGGGSLRTLRGGIHHEVVHAIWRGLPTAIRKSLVSHAESLRIMDISFADYLKAIGDPSAKNAGRQSLRQEYEDLYEGRKSLPKLIQEEAVAHMVELYSHGLLTDEQVAPVRDLLNVILADPEAAARGETKTEKSVMLGAGIGVPHEQSAQDRAASGREGLQAGEGQFAPGGAASAREGFAAFGLGADGPGFRDRAFERIIRQESASLDANGNIIAGRRSTESRTGKSGAKGNATQRVGTSQSFSAGKYEGRVKAERLDPDTDQDNLARLKYEIFKSGTPHLSDSEHFKIAQKIAALTIERSKIKGQSAEREDINNQIGVLRDRLEAANPAGYMNVVQRSDGAWEIDYVEVTERGKGVGKTLYNAVEKDLGIRMSPSGILTDAGLAFWQKRSPASVQWHEPVGGFHYSPRKISDEISRIGKDIGRVTNGEGTAANLTADERDVRIKELGKDRIKFVKMWNELPPEAKAAKDSMFAKRAKPRDPIEDTFDELRAELGLKVPPGSKKSQPPTLRQQMIAIASEGGEQIARLYGEKLAPVIGAHQNTIQDFALPLSTDRIGEGFSRFFREYVLRPNDLRTRQPELYNDFSDFLDAEAPQLLEALDKMHEQGRERLAAIKAKLNGIPGVAGGGSGGRVPPGGGTPSSGPAASPGPLPGGRQIPFTETFRKFSDGWKRTFQPELISTKSLEADPLFARYRAASAQEKDMIVARGEELHDHWNTIPEPQRLAFIRDVEIGAPQPTPELAEIAFRYRQMLDQAMRDEKIYGSKAGYVEDYFPHIWKDAAKAREVFKALSAAQNLGPKWFQKERVFDLIEEGLKHGLELKSTNPEELVAMRLMAGADMRQRMELLQQMKKMGLAIEAKGNGSFTNAGWAAINAPNMEQWLIAPDIQPIWKNAVEAKGLWSNETWVGSAFKSWMAFKNMWVPIKLALSMFHPLHVLHINMANDFARAWTQVTRAGDWQAALGSMADALTPTQGVGYEARMAWLKPREERTSFENSIVELMTDGGFVPQLSEQLRISGRRGFQKAVAEGKWLKAMPLGLRRGLEIMQGRIFERWIPGLKAAAYIKEAQALLERRPDLLDDGIQRRVALRAIAKSVDNRFGEMFYSNLFWNRTLKDAGIASFLSLGWNLGFVREFGGGTIELATRQFYQGPKPRQTIRDATNKTAFVIAYVTSAAAINAAMNYAFTGEAPEGYDFIFPRIGGLNPDGSPRRISNMFYTREVPMAKKHIESQDSVVFGIGEMIFNKMMIQPFLEIAENKDYWGYPLWDESAPLYKQALQFAEHTLFNQMSPITASGAKRAHDIGGSWLDKGVPLSFLGFGPAPAYVERTALDNRIRHLYSEYVAPQKKPYAAEETDTQKREAKDQLRLALQRGDTQAAQEARQKAREAGAKSRSLTEHSLKQNPTDYLFSRLPEQIQRDVLRDASDEERNHYRKFASRAVKKEFPAQAQQSAARVPEMAQ